MFELSKQFRFEAAHTLERVVDTESSRRIHGHSYRSEVVVRGPADPRTGMLIDLGLFERALAGARDALDHRFLDDISDLGPATMDNLASWIWRKVEHDCDGLTRVVIYRDFSGDACTYFGGSAA